MATQDTWEKSALPVAKRRPPWCPGAEDCDIHLKMAEPVLASAADPVLVVLGITPESIQADWPVGTRLVAVDSSPSIIDSMWKPNPRVHSEPICALWQDMPFGNGSVDAVIGDGSLNALPDFHQASEVLREVRRILKPGGVFGLRCFVKREPYLTPAEVAEAALRGEYPTTAAFRLPFSMALAGTGTLVKLAELLDHYNGFFPDRDELAKATGWPLEDINRADMDKGSGVRLNFPTEEEFLAQFDPCFELEGTSFGTYFQSEYCPTYQLRRRD